MKLTCELTLLVAWLRVASPARAANGNLGFVDSALVRGDEAVFIAAW